MVDDRHYLAVVNFTDLEIHDVTACLASSPGCSLAFPEVALPQAHLREHPEHHPEVV